MARAGRAKSGNHARATAGRDSGARRFGCRRNSREIAHRLRQARYYEEALAWSDGVDANKIASGAQLLFDRAVAQHALVQPEAALKTVGELRKLPGKLPRRYEELAKLIERSAARTKKTPLRGISQRMGDVDRRLELGRTGEPEIALEQTVLDELDKLINKLQEQQDQQQQQQQAASAAATPSASPPPDSQPGTLKGPGKVAPRRLAAGGEWGSAPRRTSAGDTAAFSRLSSSLSRADRSVLQTTRRTAGAHRSRGGAMKFDWLAIAAGLLYASTLLAAPAVSVSRLSGDALEGEILALEPTRLVVNIDGVEQAIELVDVLQVDFANSSTTAPVENREQIELADGSRLTGTAFTWLPPNAELKCVDAENMTLPSEAVTAVRLGTDPALTRRWNQLRRTAINRPVGSLSPRTHRARRNRRRGRRSHREDR